MRDSQDIEECYYCQTDFIVKDFTPVLGRDTKGQDRYCCSLCTIKFNKDIESLMHIPV